ncbi:MAG: MFS transporter [Cyanobacteria bacterium Co-bin8]|nr:MFS transporter [Cyanobacteria bacterium Co-bin8]
MTNPFKAWLNRWLPDLDHRIWILAGGRLLSQIGIGFTLFYAPIFFVDQVGLTATQVGLGLGIGSLAGMLGRFLGGSMADSPRWGRRPILLGSALVSALADLGLVLANDFPIFVLGNVLMGFGIGLYWPSTEAVVADITPEASHSEAFALVRLADSLGLGVGVIFGGWLIAATGAYRALFVIDGVTYLLFFALVYFTIAETLAVQVDRPSIWRGWGQALSNASLLIYVLVNVLFTTYLAQVQSTLPVYFHQFVGNDAARQGLSEATLSLLFTWHVVLAAGLQMPVARRLTALSQTRGLMISACLWGMGFTLVGLAGISGTFPVAWAAAALSIMALAMVAYTPIASALVVMLAPKSQRGIYLSINSMCWAVGYAVGPPLGGWALDQGAAIANGFWIIMALTVVPALGILHFLEQRLDQRLE